MDHSSVGIMKNAQPTTHDPSGSQSVDRALRLLALVGRGAERGTGLSDIVEGSGLNKPTARRLLLALMRAGLIEQEAYTKRYFLGEEAYVLGTLASRRHGLLELSLESLRNLSKATNDTSFLSVRRENYAVCLHREEGSYPVRSHALLTGDQHPLGIGAGSLAILAALPDGDIENVLTANEKVLDAQYPGFSSKEVRLGVAETRERGYSLNPGLIVAGSWGIGVAINFPDGRVAGALSLAAIDSRVSAERQPELVRHLRLEKERIEAKLHRMFAPTPKRSMDPERSRAWNG